MVRRRALISGRVQGVGYRRHAQRAAQQLGLHGWVRNRHDGRVELEVAGPAEQVARFLAWCEHGPPAARVSDVDWVAVDGGEPLPAEFSVRPTA
ncbi:MAG: acylphosphatase [Planctomycetota bacterium]